MLKWDCQLEVGLTHPLAGLSRVFCWWSVTSFRDHHSRAETLLSIKPSLTCAPALTSCPRATPAWLTALLMSWFFKVLECVPRLCQLGSQGLPRWSSSRLGISEARVQEGAVFWEPLRHVCQPHHPRAHHRACAPEPSSLWADQPGDPEGTSVQAQPHPRHCALPHMQHSAGVQDLTCPHTSRTAASRWSTHSPEYWLEERKDHILDTSMRLPSCLFPRTVVIFLFQSVMIKLKETMTASMPWTGGLPEQSQLE